MPITPEAYIEQARETILAELLEFLRIPSISTQESHRDDVRTAADWVAAQLRAAGLPDVRVMDTAGHPVVFGRWEEAPGAPTLLVYGHYDVQPPDPLDRWQSDPFIPTIREGRIYARGASDDKGPMFVPIKTIQAFFAAEGRLPVNVKVLFEGEEEIGSAHLEPFVRAHADLLRADYTISADGAMWRPSEPSITTGSRGLAGLELSVYGPRTDLHSGRHGGAVQNPLHALAGLIASLHRDDGTVAVDGFYAGVKGPSAAERERIAALAFDEDAYRRSLALPALYGEAGYSTLERQWLRPTLEVNGLYGGYQGPGGKTVIPAEAHAKITCRLVPDQDPAAVLAAVRRHLEAHVDPGVRLEVREQPGSAPAYRLDDAHPGLQVAREALRVRYNQEPVTVLMGGTLPISAMFKEVLGQDTIYFSFSTADEDFHAPNEFFRLSRLWDGIACWIDFWRRAGSA